MRKDSQRLGAYIYVGWKEYYYINGFIVFASISLTWMFTPLIVHRSQPCQILHAEVSISLINSVAKINIELFHVTFID